MRIQSLIRKLKRFHEYKRQQMNALYVIHKYLEIKTGKLPKRKITVIFWRQSGTCLYYCTGYYSLNSLFI